MRYTKRDAINAFKRLCEARGKENADDGKYRNINPPTGAWILDCNHTYGGYKIAEIANEHGGERDVTYTRLSTREFIEACDFTLSVLDKSRA